MHISQSIKAVFFIVNHIAATHIPREAFPARLYGDREPADNPEDVSDMSYGSWLSHGDALVARKVSPSSDNNIWAYRESCGGCKEDCPKAEIKDPKDCKKCAKCPNGEKANPEQTKCIKDDKKDCIKCPAGKITDPKNCKVCIDDKKDDDKDCAKCPAGKVKDPKDCKKCVDEKKEEKCPRCPGKQIRDRKDCTKCIPADKQKLLESLRKTMSKKVREIKKSSKTKNMKELKESKKRFFRDHEDERKRKRSRRAGKCLPLLQLSMGGKVAEEMDGLFDEAFTESMELMDYWPSDLNVAEVDKWESDKDDAKFDAEDYINKYVKAGEGKPDAPSSKKRSIDLDEEVEDGVSSNNGDAEGLVCNGNPSSHNITSQDSTLADRAAKLHAAAAARRQNNVPEKFRRRADTPSSTTVVPATTTDLVVRDRNTALLEKRIIPALIAIFSAIAQLVVRMAPIIARVARLGAQLVKNGIRLTKGRNGKPRIKQREGAKKISQDRNWHRCLRGWDPEV